MNFRNEGRFLRRIFASFLSFFCKSAFSLGFRGVRGLMFEISWRMIWQFLFVFSTEQAKVFLSHEIKKKKKMKEKK